MTDGSSFPLLLRPALLAAALAPALASQVVVVPRVATVVAGRTQVFQAQRLPGDRRPVGTVAWSVVAEDGQAAGAVDPVTGTFTAPEADGPRTLRVRAEAGGAGAEAQVTVLPDQPFRVVEQVLGRDWLEAVPTDLPFLDLESNRRFPGRVEECFDLGRMPGQRVGYGQPCRLAWHPPKGTGAQLLSYREGGILVRRDVTGLDQVTLVPRAPIENLQVEGLVGRESGSGWRSWVMGGEVWVRGWMPWAGSGQVPGHADGSGSSARFRAPGGMATLPPGAGGWRLAVADPEDHVVRLVDARGRVTTLCGEPGQAGHRDRPADGGGWWFCRRRTPSQPARLQRPTHLAYLTWSPPRLQGLDLVLADSGNHVLRGLARSGEVTTLAGSPGLAGHRDADDPHQALFDDPRGVAVVPNGWIYVADRGNRVIRAMDASGRVTTLAGCPGQAGTLDGLGAEARFTDLKALVCVRAGAQGCLLLVLDGHAVRQVDPDTGRVTTVVGQVAGPGFQDVGGPGRATRLQALAGPCLRDPVDLLWYPKRQRLIIADRGNHAVRSLDWRDRELITMAGEPGQGDLHWGLLQDALPVPTGPDYAGLGSPQGLAQGPEFAHGNLVVATGSCLGTLRDGPSRDQVDYLRVQGPWTAALGEVVVVRAGVGPARPGAQGGPGRVTVDFLEPDGSVGRRVEEEATPGQEIALTGWFDQPGTGRVVVRHLAPGGISTGVQLEVEVR